MKRRLFLGTLASGLAIDPEKLLWKPGVKKIFLPVYRKCIVYESSLMVEKFKVGDFVDTFPYKDNIKPTKYIVDKVTKFNGYVYYKEEAYCLDTKKFEKSKPLLNSIYFNIRKFLFC